MVAGVSRRLDTVLVGENSAMRNIRDDIRLAAQSDAKVLITGETGTGKEVVAQLIHQESSRATAELVCVNCAGIPDSLLESELFGHVRGSFTGAHRDRVGLLEVAGRGTIFLDEVGEMSMRMQAVLLRFLETGEIQRVGADRAHTRVNARLITATNRELQERIRTGTFREDLFFRLNVIRIDLPPLRERLEDVPALVAHLVEGCRRLHGVPRAEISPAAMEILQTHSWPGNIRELRNVVERLVLRAPAHPIRPEDLPAGLFSPTPPPLPIAVAAAWPSVALERADRMINHRESFWSVVYSDFMAHDLTREELRGIVQVGLQRTNGNYKRLAQLFGMADSDYKRFMNFLRKHDCQLPFREFRSGTSSHSSPAAAPA